MLEQLDINEIQPEDFVKVAVGNEKLWFQVKDFIENNAYLCRLVSEPVTGVIFDGLCTIDKDWIIDAVRGHKRELKLVIDNTNHKPQKTETERSGG